MNHPCRHNWIAVLHHGKVGLNRGAMLALRTGHNSRWGAIAMARSARRGPDRHRHPRQSSPRTETVSVGIASTAGASISVSMPALIRERSAQSGRRNDGAALPRLRRHLTNLMITAPSKGGG
jgi:hypothetical protein